MQVFTSEFGDYHRTRLTHTLEVTSLARTLARALELNEDLVEALALLHDIGHPPFGHTGEEVLDVMLETEGGFNHNMQALRIVEKLERRYPEFPGLNLSLEVLEGQRYKYEKKTDPDVPTPLLEVQVVDVADSVSYDSHDADDAIEIGLIALNDLKGLALWRRASDQVNSRWSSLSEIEFRQAVIHALIDIQVGNILDAMQRRLSEQHIDSLEAVRRSGILAEPDVELREQKRELEHFLFDRVYRHPKVVLARREMSLQMSELFRYHELRADRLPSRYFDVMETEGPARATADYLADLTDRGIRMEHAKLLHDRILKPRKPMERK